jgi:acyl-[acyl-carrier-protein]-phospholipid O-acyltransferase/long-chain-fatty-acid--[acyl-carrier-protein] ligase
VGRARRGRPVPGRREEAALLFTSGSAGAPRGVVLSHRNLLANCQQISCTSILPNAGTMLGCLPVFHSFGFTFTLWYPLLMGCRLVTTPSPLDSRAVIDSIREEGVTILLGAPTFVRPLLKKAGRPTCAP